MVKRIQCFLTDSEALAMEKAKERLDVTTDYAFVKLAILELCNKTNANKGGVSVVEEAKWMCSRCGYPLAKVEGLKACPRCGHTKYRKRP